MKLSNGLPSKWAICECCGGSGHVENPAFSNGFTYDEFNETFDDEESREDYFAGAYDVACDACESSGKVQVIDVASCTFAQKRVAVMARKEAREEAQDARESAALYRAEMGFF